MTFDTEQVINKSQDDLTNTQEEESVKPEEENSDKPEEEETEKLETSEEEATDDSEYFVDDEDYLQSFHEKGLPPHIKTLDEAVQYGIDSGKQMQNQNVDANKLNQLNAMLVSKGLNGGIDALLAGVPLPQTQPQQNPLGFQNQQVNNQQTTQQQSVFPDKPFSAIIEEAIKTGRITTESAAEYRGVAQMNDMAFKQVSEPMEKGMVMLYEMFNKLNLSVQGHDYKFLNKKIRDSVPKYELDAIVNSGRANDYKSALFLYAQEKNPELLLELANRQPSQPEKKKRPTSLRGKKRTAPDAGIGKYSKFINSDGTINEAAIGRAYPTDFDMQVKILEDIAKLTK